MFRKINKKFIRNILITFLILKITLTLGGIFARTSLPHGGGMHLLEESRVSNMPTFLTIWGVWDSYSYLIIADQGYYRGTITNEKILEQSFRAFFPLYPLLMHILGNIIGSKFIAGIFISNICFLLALLYLYKLVRLDYDEKTSQLGVWIMLLFPTSFLFGAVLTESLFLLLIITTIYYARAGNLLLMIICGGLLTATRSAGILFLIPLFLILFKANLQELLKLNIPKNILSKENIAKVLSLIAITFGLIAYMIYSKITTDDFLAFSTVMSLWGREYIFPLSALLNAIINGRFFSVLGAYYSIFIFLLICSGFKKIRLEYFVIAMILLIFPLFSSSHWTHIESMPRYIAPIFPIFIILAIYLRNYFDHINKRNLSITNIFKSNITVFLGILFLLQNLLMLFWTNAYFLIV